MNILTAIIKGWALVLRYPLFWLLKWGINLVFAFLLLQPLAEGLRSFLANRANAETFVTQPSLAGIAEFLEHYKDQTQALTESWLLLLVLFAVINIALSAGIIHVFAGNIRGEKASFRMGVRRHFLPLALVPLLFLGVAVLGMNFWRWFTMAITNLDLPSWTHPLVAVFALWLIWLAWLVYDYTRILICTRPNSHRGVSADILMAFIHPISAFFRALILVVSKPAVWLVALAFLAVHALIVLGLGQEWFGDNGQSTTLLALGLAQLVVLARIVTGLGLWGAETTLCVQYQMQKAQSTPLTPEETTPYRESPPSEEESVFTQAAPEPIEADESGMLGEDEDDEYLLASRRPSPEDQGSG